MAKKIVKRSSRNRRVSKMFSPEEMTALSNISSIINELMQMGGNEGTPIVEEEEPSDPVAPKLPIKNNQPDSDMSNTDDSEDTEEKEVKMIVKNLDTRLSKILKGLETTPSDSATASDDAEERIDEPQTELSEENLNEVAKTIALLLAGKSTVKKSAPKSTALEQILDRLVSVQKSTQEGIDELSEAFGHILKGMGIAKQLEISKSEEDKKGREEQITKTQNEELLKFFQQIRNVTKDADNSGVKNVSGKSQTNEVRKNIGTREVLTALVGGSSRN